MNRKSVSRTSVSIHVLYRYKLKGVVGSKFDINFLVLGNAGIDHVNYALLCYIIKSLKHLQKADVMHI